ncbi:MAG: hypothetical protein JSU70_13320 [Phycisphaerales bacterium]|nr:MAG: hypothetical protein JSU70_13320 [Phycisphaerales bacterium]
MRSIWAVAVNTIRQALRMKIAAIFVVLLLVLLPVLGFTTTGDGTLKGRLQTFVSYGLSLTSILLCLLTLVASVYTITSDIEQRQIFTVITKPIRRFELLFGKLLGVVLLDAGLLVLFCAIIYGITAYMPSFYAATEAERTEAANEFYTARANLVLPDLDVSKEAAEDYGKLKATGQLAQFYPGFSEKEILDQLTKRRRLEKRAAPAGHELLWEFENVRPLDPGERLFIRFKYDVSVNPPDSYVYSRWLVGDYRQIKYGTPIVTPIYEPPMRKDPIRTFREIEVPADAVAEDGYLAVAFLNVTLNNMVVIFPLEDGLEVLYKADTFTANFIRAALLILLRLIFLACLGILAASFLSFPVAMMFCLAIFVTANFSGFVLESFSYMSDSVYTVYSYTLKWVIWLLPQFDKFNPAKFLVPGRLLSWSLVARVAGLVVCVRGFLMLLLGLLIFSFREIARIVV